VWFQAVALLNRVLSQFLKSSAIVRMDFTQPNLKARVRRLFICRKKPNHAEIAYVIWFTIKTCSKSRPRPCRFNSLSMWSL